MRKKICETVFVIGLPEMLYRFSNKKKSYKDFLIDILQVFSV